MTKRSRTGPTSSGRDGLNGRPKGSKKDLTSPTPSAAEQELKDAFALFLESDEAMAPVLENARSIIALGHRQPPDYKADPNTPGGVALETKKDAFFYQMTEATGTLHYDAGFGLVSDILRVVGNALANPAGALRHAFGHMLDIAPRDGLEGMLAAQMVAVHTAAMAELANSRDSGQHPDLRTDRVNRASRLMKLFATQMETLNRNRGKAPSEQRVTVEHVHVHEGGQAVVGNVTQTRSAETGEG